MDLTVSRPIKILALVGVLAAVAGAGAMTLLGRGQPQSSSASLPTVAQLRAQAHTRAAAAAKTHPAKPAVAVAARPKTKVAAPAKAKPTAHKAVPAKPAATTPKPAAEAPVDANGLPLPLADALRAHRIVVVSIFDPQAQADAISYAEARAGAGDAHVGFLGVSVLDDAVAGPLTAVLPGGGLLPDPGLLFYRAPGVLVLRIDGFADRDAVAQAAVAALTADPIVAPAAPTPAVTTTVPDTVPLPTTTTGP